MRPQYPLRPKDVAAIGASGLTQELGCGFFEDFAKGMGQEELRILARAFHHAADLLDAEAIAIAAGLRAKGKS